ncbi:MAG: galactose/methyl galactoside ABC transporter permease MglC, partial [Oscillospiraceae bacterium]|nr:galactose/methyl galactoside ABC transporter permease MglC [Oscillospiraceae bacterium]
LVIVIMDPSILTLNSLTTILTQSSTRCILALGVAGLIVLAGTDLSIGRMVGMGAVLAGSLLQAPDFARRIFPNLPSNWGFIFLVIALVILVLAVASAISGTMVAKLKMHPFIATLGMQLILYGACTTYYNIVSGSPIGSLNEDFKSLAQGKLIDLGSGGSLSFLVLYAGVAIAVIWFIWNKTTFGKNMFAVGGNTEAAAVSGVNVDKTIITTYVLAGILYGVAAVLELGRTGSATNNLGVNYETDAISACVVGGVSFNGGVGTIGGVVLGVLLLQAINFGLAYVDVDPNLQYIVKGLIILIAVAIDMRKYVKKK